MIIALTGASGFLGQRLIRALRADRHDLRVLGRNPVQGLPFWPWDLMAGEPPAEALAGAHAVVHLAGEPVAQRWTPEAKRRILDSRVVGTRHLVHALSTQSPRPAALVSASAVGIYGSRGDEVLTETSRPGTGFLPDVAESWEREARLAEALGVRVVSLRLGVVLGSEGGALRKMLPIFRLGLGGRLGSGKQWMSWIHVDDAVRLITFALQEKSLRGPVNATAPNPTRNAEFTRSLAAALHRPALAAVPAFALKLLYGEMAEVLLGSQRALPNAAQASQYRFLFPDLAPALADVVQASTLS